MCFVFERRVELLIYYYAPHLKDSVLHASKRVLISESNAYYLALSRDWRLPLK